MISILSRWLIASHTLRLSDLAVLGAVLIAISLTHRKSGYLSLGAH